MIITLTGVPGSGKTTAAKKLSEKFDLKWYSMGNMRREMAQARGMTIDEFNVLGETEKFTDEEVDNFQTELGKTQDDFIADGRVSWHFIPNSFKVFLDVDTAVSAERIFKDSKEGNRESEGEYASVEEVQEKIEHRMESDKNRYLKYYEVDYLDHSNYDLVVDTSNINPDEVLEEIVKGLEKFEQN